MDKKQRKRREKQARHQTQSTVNVPVVLGEQEGTQINRTKEPDPPKDTASQNKNPSWIRRFAEWTHRNDGFLVAIFTGALVAIGFFQVRIYTRQADINASQLEVGRNDQRAWIQENHDLEPVRPEEPNIGVVEGMPIKAKAVFVNTGKTPAYNLSARMVVRVIENDVPNTFGYESYIGATTGALFPNTPLSQEFLSTEASTTGTVVPHPVSHYEYSELINGRAYIAMYVETSYCDIFRVAHGIRRCFFHGLKPDGKYTAKECTDYNSADNNTIPDFKFCPVVLSYVER